MANALLSNIVDEIVNPIVLLLFVLAVIYFIWGVIRYVINADSDEERGTGRKHMIWGVVGMFIMAAVLGIIAIIENTIGV